MDDLHCVSAAKPGHGPRRHGRRGTDLRLTASCRSGNERAVRDHTADTCRHIKCLNQLFRRIMLHLLEGEQNRREHAAGACGRCCHDPLHTGIGLAHFYRLFHDKSDQISTDQLLLCPRLRQLFSICSGKSACRYPFCLVTGVRLFHCLIHGAHLRFGFRLLDPALFAVIRQNRLIKTAAFCRFANFFQ